MNFIPKYELAFRYFPDAPTKHTATNNLARAINRCKPLAEALAKTYYNVNAKCFSPRQVALIYEFLGEP